MALLIVTFLHIVVSICVVKAYYLSPNLLTFSSANYFCVNQCKSSLASIHSQSQFDEAVKLIYYDTVPIISTSNTSTYIGIVNVDDTLQWIDETSFDFGEDLLDGDAKQCVVFTPDTQQWLYVECDFKARALCNHCDGVLNKYIINLERNPVNAAHKASQHCNDLAYPSELSSFHTERDFEELRTLCTSINGTNNCWTGLYATGSSTPWDLKSSMFYDGTTADFDTDSVSPERFIESDNYPWGNSQPQDIAGNVSSYLNGNDVYLLTAISNEENQTRAYPICNRPSELCFMDSTTMSVSNNGCVYSTNMQNGYQFAQLNPTMFYNGDDTLKMELRFRIIDMISLFTTAEWPQSFRLEVTSPCTGDHYNFGLTRDSGGLWLEMGFNGNIIKYDWITDNETDSTIFYTLYVSIVRVERGLQFQYSFDDFDIEIDSDLDIDEGYPYGIVKNGYSGFISVYTDSASIEFESLYISGTMHKEFDTDLCTINSLNTTLYIVDIEIILTGESAIGITAEVMEIVRQIAWQNTAPEDRDCFTTDYILGGFEHDFDREEAIINLSAIVCNEQKQEQLYTIYNATLEEDIFKLDFEGDLDVLITITRNPAKSVEPEENVETEAPADASVAAGDDTLLFIVIGSGSLLLIIVLGVIMYTCKKKTATNGNTDTSEMVNIGPVHTQINKMDKVQSYDDEEKRAEPGSAPGSTRAVAAPNPHRQESTDSLWGTGEEQQQQSFFPFAAMVATEGASTTPRALNGEGPEDVNINRQSTTPRI